MGLFISTFSNKVDRKGRISVPAAFRAAVEGSGFPGVVIYRSFTCEAIEGCGFDRMEEMADRLETLEQFSDEYESLSGLFADATQLAFDAEGRIMLPEVLRVHAGIGLEENARFVGRGRTFQIWNPAAHDAADAASRQHLRRNRVTLPPLRPASAPAPAAKGAGA